ncbi:MAG: hypothetical protein ACYDGY_09700, partial [Acidimicrobiales bacterium]
VYADAYSAYAGAHTRHPVGRASKTEKEKEMDTTPDRQTFEVDLVVRGLDLDDDNQITQVFDMFGDDVQVSGSSEDGMIHLLLDTHDPITGTHAAIARLNSALVQVEVLRIDPGLVAIPDIARRIDCSRENIRKYADGTRGPGGFPAPEGVVGDGIRVWRWANVEPWLRDNTSYDFPTVPIPGRQADAINASLGNVGRLVGTVTRDARQDYILIRAGQPGVREPTMPLVTATPPTAWKPNSSKPFGNGGIAA